MEVIEVVKWCVRYSRCRWKGLDEREQDRIEIFGDVFIGAGAVRNSGLTRA